MNAASFGTFEAVVLIFDEERTADDACIELEVIAPGLEADRQLDAAAHVLAAALALAMPLDERWIVRVDSNGTASMFVYLELHEASDVEAHRAQRFLREMFERWADDACAGRVVVATARRRTGPEERQ